MIYMRNTTDQIAKSADYMGMLVELLEQLLYNLDEFSASSGNETCPPPPPAK